MTKEEAKLFFQWEDGEDPEEVWEEKLFEQKQFFLTRPPIPKVFFSRLKKLKKTQQAYLVLTEQEDEIALSKSNDAAEVAFSENVIEAFNQQQQYRMKMKAEVLRANTFVALEKSINTWLELERMYLEKWRVEDSGLELDVVISKEPDPMELLQILREFEKTNGVLTFKNVKNELERLPVMIKNECKRLNLLYDKSYGG